MHDEEINILTCWYSGQITEKDFCKLLLKNKRLLDLWHTTMIDNIKKNDKEKKEIQQQHQKDSKKN